MTTPNLKLINGGDVSSDSSGGGVTSEFVMQCLEANELGDGMLYAALHQNQYVYSKNSDQWYYWNGHAWRRDDLDRAEAAVENVAIRYAKEIERLGVQLSKAMAEGDESAQKTIKDKIGQIHKRVRRLRTDTGRRHCLKFAHTNPQNPLAIHGKEFDQDPWLLACANGVINLRTGELEPGRPEDCLSKRSPVEWQGIDADAGPWEQMLLEIHDGDEDLVAYKQRLYGYGITGLTIEHVFPVFFGRGRNGKSVEIETIAARHVAHGGEAHRLGPPRPGRGEGRGQTIGEGKQMIMRLFRRAAGRGRAAAGSGRWCASPSPIPFPHHQRRSSLSLPPPRVMPRLGWRRFRTYLLDAATLAALIGMEIVVFYCIVDMMVRATG